ncbi:MAG: hypothetical protein PF508_11315 [Spirochaeta sp.]|jgi:hypothetical protein|nr:hypothetical protein [Spirochaeta sp.]
MITPRRSQAYILLVACICAASVTAAAPPVSAQAGARDPVTWYRSDADMIRRDPIAAGRGAAGGETPPTGVVWALAVRQEETSRERLVEVARLYHNGVYRGYERTELTDRGVLPLERERFDQDDELLYREVFRYRRDGTLRETLRTDAAGDTVLILYGMAEDAWDEYVEAPDYTLLRRFDDRGRPAYTRREGRRDAAARADATATADTVREEWYSYRDGRMSERRVHEGERREVYRYRDGVIVFEVIRAAGRVVRTVERTFDEAGRVTEVIVREAGTVRREIWNHETDGSFEMERIVDGDLVFRERTTADGEGTVTRYRAGEPVVREFYADDTLYRRHIFADGEIVRVEEL